jgi:hypothetical protein
MGNDHSSGSSSGHYNRNPDGGFYNGKTSLGDYSHKGTFGQAFNSAHQRGGEGHTFSYNGKNYNTN